MKTNVFLKNRYAKILAIPVILFVLLANCDENKSPVSPVESTLIDFIKSDPDYSILADLLESTILNSTLSGTANYTILAPTDAAFAKLPEGILDDLTDAQLLGILKYHVIHGQVQVNTSNANMIH